ncbi:MAG: tetratricopeptide repeat protein [Spirochaetota bacterium]
MIKILIFLFLILNSYAYAKNADDLYRDGQFSEAEKAYQQGDMDDPKDLRYRYNKGCAAYQNKDYQGAEAAFTSVLRRSKDSAMLSRAAYNLGNTAFVQDDFAAAAEFYKQAIIYNPDNSDAKYNLELSLKKLEEEKKNPDKKNNKDNKNEKKNNQKEDQNPQKGEKGNDSRKNKEDKSGESGSPKDLSGKLNSANPMGEKPKEALSPAQMLERKKAEALLDNVKEDRAKILQMQSPKDKRRTDSGKSW